jgi:hypothetical protein
MSNVHFISYADKKFLGRIDVLKSICNKTDWFDSHYLLTDTNISNEFKNKYDYILKYNSAGCWIWKAEIIRQLLKTTSNGDIIIYADAGCTLNLNDKSKENFDKYIDLTNRYNMLRFELRGELPEWKYTNKFALEFFRDNYNLKKEHALSNQLVGGIIYVNVCEHSRKYFDMFFEIVDKDHDLITSKYDQCENVKGFVSHRHDQSILSLLSKVTGLGHIIPDETYPTNPNFEHYFSEEIFNKIKEHDQIGQFPIIATRSKI